VKIQLKVHKSSHRRASDIPISNVVQSIVSEVGGRGVRRGIAHIVPFLSDAVNVLLCGRVP